jgi:Tripartite tricarboxylate transporter TctB family
MSPASSDGTMPPVAPGAATPPGRKRIHSDVIIALGIIAFCAVVYGITLTFDTIPAVLMQGMGAAAFPQLLLGVMVLLALVLAWSSRGRPDEAREPIPAMVYLTGAAMLAFMAILWLAGMLVAIVAAIVGIGALWGERRWAILVASGVGVAAFLYVMFTRGFGIPLPRGLLGEWLV